MTATNTLTVRCAPTMKYLRRVAFFTRERQHCITPAGRYDRPSGRRQAGWKKEQPPTGTADRPTACTANEKS